MISSLSQSRFIAFFDESGDHSLTKVDKDFPLFVLCTVIVERRTYAETIVPAFGKFKLGYFAHEGINLHSRDIRKSEGPFNILQDTRVREHFFPELSQIIKEVPFILFITCIQKIPYAKRYGDGAIRTMWRWNILLSVFFILWRDKKSATCPSSPRLGGGRKMTRSALALTGC